MRPGSLFVLLGGSGVRFGGACVAGSGDNGMRLWRRYCLRVGGDIDGLRLGDSCVSFGGGRWWREVVATVACDYGGDGVRLRGGGLMLACGVRFVCGREVAVMVSGLARRWYEARQR